MNRACIHYILCGLLVLLTACDENENGGFWEDDDSPLAEILSLSLPEVIIQDFEIKINGSVQGEIDKLQMLVDDKLVRTASVREHKYQFRYEFQDFGSKELRFQGVNSRNEIVMDTLKEISVVQRKAQAIHLNDKQNKLGLWIWYLGETGFQSHQDIAEKISGMGVKRVFIKVADGKTVWSEADNKAYENNESFLSFYGAKNLEVFAWSYNYPGNEELQSEALYRAAKAGFDGYVLDLEVEFDGKEQELESLMQAFYLQMMRAIKEGYIDDSFPLIVTSWGNPKDHDMRVDIIDKYVDAHMPQTYLEKWGGTWLSNPENTIDVGNAEYKSLGAFKPVCHIFSAENVGETAIQPEILNRAVKYAGAQSSIWKIPGSNMGGNWRNNWSILEEIDWKYDYNIN